MIREFGLLSEQSVQFDVSTLQRKNQEMLLTAKGKKNPGKGHGSPCMTGKILMEKQQSGTVNHAWLYHLCRAGWHGKQGKPPRPGILCPIPSRFLYTLPSALEKVLRSISGLFGRVPGLVWSDGKRSHRMASGLDGSLHKYYAVSKNESKYAELQYIVSNN